MGVETLTKQHTVINSYSASHDAQWEGIGDVRLARCEPALLPPCPTIRVLSYSNYSTFRNSAL